MSNNKIIKKNNNYKNFPKLKKNILIKITEVKFDKKTKLKEDKM
jgi:hypothetical protein